MYRGERLKRLFIERNIEAGAGAYSLRQLAVNEDVYAAACRKANAENWVDAMQADGAESEERISAEVVRRIEINHATIRQEALEERSYHREVLLDQVRRWKRWFKEHPEERMPLKELMALQKVITELAVVGGGLPREHVIQVDDAHDDLILNQEEQKAVAANVLSIREWKKRRDKERGDG